MSLARTVPDARGRFGRFGGRYVPETLVPALEELDAAYRAARADPAFTAELEELLRDFVGRATPLTEAPRLTAHAGGARILLKREDLAHTGAHKINNTMGQGLLAMRMGKSAHHRRDRRRASTAWPPPRPAPASAWSAWSTWARRTCAARSPTSAACG